MSRKILQASLLHAEPSVIQRLKNDECNRMSVAWRIRQNEIIVQANRIGDSPATLYEAPFAVWAWARTQGFDGVRFHCDGPLLDFPIYDKELVGAGFEHDPICEEDVRNQWADESLDTLRKNEAFNETPLCYERMAQWHSHLISKLDYAKCDRMKLDENIEEIVRIGHASGHSKSDGRNFWSRCDNAFKKLVADLDRLLVSTAPEWDHQVAWLEGIIFAAQFSLSHSVRATSVYEPRRHF